MSSPVLYKSGCFDKLPRLLLWTLSLYCDSQEPGRWRIYVPLLCKCPLWWLTIFQKLQWIFKICRECEVALCNHSTPKKRCWAKACPAFPEQWRHCWGGLNLRKEVGKPLLAWASVKRGCRVSMYCPEQPWLPDSFSSPSFLLQLCLFSDVPFNACGVYLYVINNYNIWTYKDIFHIIEIVVVIYIII